MAQENATKETKIKELNDVGKNKAENLEKRHVDKKKQLNKKIEDLELMLTNSKEKNKKEEEKLRGDFTKAENTYKEILGQYDAEMQEHTKDREKALAEHDETHHELAETTEQYK